MESKARLRFICATTLAITLYTASLSEKVNSCFWPSTQMMMPVASGPLGIPNPDSKPPAPTEQCRFILRHIRSRGAVVAAI